MRKIFFAFPVVLTTIISGSNFDSAKASPYYSSWYVKYYNSYNSYTNQYGNYRGQGYRDCDGELYVTSGSGGNYSVQTSRRQDCN